MPYINYQGKNNQESCVSQLCLQVGIRGHSDPPEVQSQPYKALKIAKKLQTCFK